MQPVPKAFLTKGIEFLDMCIRHPSDWVTIDETGYLEQTIPAYQEAISRLLAAKHVLLVVRKQKLPFLDALCKRDDCFLVDLDKLMETRSVSSWHPGKANASVPINSSLILMGNH